MMTEAVKAAIYCRVSSEEQVEEKGASDSEEKVEKGASDSEEKRKISLGFQRQKAEAHCEAQGWEVHEVYEDAGVSGAKSDRPALANLLADAQAGKFQRVVFLKLDRFGRNLRDLLNNSFSLKEYDVGIVSVQDSFDTSTPSGRLFFSVLGAMAEFERDLIRERTAMGKRGGAKKGRYNTGWTALGYDYDRETQRLVINEAEAAVVRRIFKMYLQDGLSQRRMAERLNAEGVPTKTLQTRSKDGIKKGWTKNHIARVLTGTCYNGEAYFGKTAMSENGQNRRKRPTAREEWVRIDCPAIVTPEDFEAAQAKAKRNKRESQRPKDKVTTFILGGLIRCRECGRPMYGYTLRRRRRGKVNTWSYYYCSGQHRYGLKCRQFERVNADKIEGPLLVAIIEAFSDPGKVLEACRAYTQQLQDAQDAQEGHLAELRSRLARVGTERDNAVALCTKGLITEADLVKRLKKQDDEAGRWAEELARLEEASRQRGAAREIEQTARVIAEQIRPTVGEMTLDERKELVRAVVERVWVDANNELDIECAVPNLLPDRGKVAPDNPV